MPGHRSLLHRQPYVRSPAPITLICRHGRRRIQAQPAVQNGGSVRVIPDCTRHSAPHHRSAPDSGRLRIQPRPCWPAGRPRRAGQGNIGRGGGSGQVHLAGRSVLPAEGVPEAWPLCQRLHRHRIEHAAGCWPGRPGSCYLRSMNFPDLGKFPAVGGSSPPSDTDFGAISPKPRTTRTRVPGGRSS
jgi:hypothetical protein